MKSVSRFAMVAALGAALVGCGQRVEVPPGHVGKSMGTEGYYSGVIPTSLYRDWETTQDRKSTRLNSSHSAKSRMPSSA